MSKKKTFFLLSYWSILAACAQAQPPPSLNIACTFFNPEHPELIRNVYQNMGYHVYADYWNYAPPEGTMTTACWSIKSTGPDPVYPTFNQFVLIMDSSRHEEHNGLFHVWGAQDHGMIFAHHGIFVFRFGMVHDLPWEHTPQERWENMEATGYYDEDTLDFDWDVPDAEMQISQACPWNWLPVIDGYIDGTGQPNHDAFKVTLKAFFRSQNPPQSYKLRWVLKNISWYTGACMNYYGRLPNGDSLASDLERGGGGAVDPPAWYLADLMILNLYNPNLTCWYDTTQHAFYGQTAGTINSNDTISVVVSCYDFGAHGDIFVEAQEDSASIFMNLTKHLEADGQYVNFTTIPRDEDNTYKDYLADYWEGLKLLDPHCPDTIRSILQITPIPDIDDYIHGVLPCELGDYLNVFEEYRGFYCRGVHTRTSPWEKDFFVCSNLDTFKTGLGYANQIGPGLAHLIDSTEMRNYFEPNINHWSPQDELAKSINWYADRIDSHANCPATIVLEKLDWAPGDSLAPIGQTGYLSGLGYSIPKTTTCSYIFVKRIQYHTPPRSNPDSLDLPADTLCWHHVTGHEIGHSVDFRESSDTTSIMTEYLRNFTNPPDQYRQADLDSFLVKPIQP